MTEQGKTVEQLKKSLGAAILGVESQYDFQVVTVDPVEIISVLSFLYHHPDLQYQYLTTLCGIHYPQQQKMAVMYQVHSLSNNLRLRLKTYLPELHPRIQSITPLFKAANWMERETYDFYGIIFEGHPNLKRILNVDEMLIYPMRKEYPLEDQIREDKNDALFGR